MRRLARVPEDRRVRFLVDVLDAEGGRVSGVVTAGDGPSTTFSGWLELLRVLEDGTSGPSTGAGVDAGADPDDVQEDRWQ